MKKKTPVNEKLLPYTMEIVYVSKTFKSKLQALETLKAVSLVLREMGMRIDTICVRKTLLTKKNI